MNLPDFDPYRELEVHRSASLETIEAAYRSLIKRAHPDSGRGDVLQAKRLNIARDCLADPRCREAYDSSHSEDGARPGKYQAASPKPTRNPAAHVPWSTVASGLAGLLGLLLAAAAYAFALPPAQTGIVVMAGAGVAVVGALGLLIAALGQVDGVRGFLKKMRHR